MFNRYEKLRKVFLLLFVVSFISPLVFAEPIKVGSIQQAIPMWLVQTVFNYVEWVTPIDGGSFYNLDSAYGDSIGYSGTHVRVKFRGQEPEVILISEFIDRLRGFGINIKGYYVNMQFMAIPGYPVDEIAETSIIPYKPISSKGQINSLGMEKKSIGTAIPCPEMSVGNVHYKFENLHCVVGNDGYVNLDHEFGGVQNMWKGDHTVIMPGPKVGFAEGYSRPPQVKTNCSDGVQLSGPGRFNSNFKKIGSMGAGLGVDFFTRTVTPDEIEYPVCTVVGSVVDCAVTNVGRGGSLKSICASGFRSSPVIAAASAPFEETSTSPAYTLFHPKEPCQICGKDKSDRDHFHSRDGKPPKHIYVSWEEAKFNNYVVYPGEVVCDAVYGTFYGLFWNTGPAHSSRYQSTPWYQ